MSFAIHANTATVNKVDQTRDNDGMKRDKSLSKRSSGV
jgi:hypothetical protein